MRKSAILALCAGALVLAAVAAYAIGFKYLTDGIAEDTKPAERNRNTSIINEYVAVTRGTVIEIENDNGSVEVECRDNDTIHVSGTLGAAVLPLDIIADGDRVVIGAKYRTPPHGMFKDRTEYQADLHIKVPSRCALNIKTVNADQDVKEFRGMALQCKTVNGDIKCWSIADNTVCETVNGDIVYSGKCGMVKAHSVSGDVSVYNEIWGAYDISTQSGDIVIHGAVKTACAMNVRSVNGDITLALPDNLSARFEINSVNGDISNEFPCRDTRNEGKAGKKRFTGTIGNGDGKVRAKTTNGDVNVKRLS